MGKARVGPPYPGRGGTWRQGWYAKPPRARSGVGHVFPATGGSQAGSHAFGPFEETPLEADTHEASTPCLVYVVNH